MAAPLSLAAICVLLIPLAVVSFVVPTVSSPSSLSSQLFLSSSSSPNDGGRNQRATITIDAQLDDDKVTSLFAWVSRAFAGEPRYNNLMLALVAIFGNLPDESEPVVMAKEALEKMTEAYDEETPVGDPIPIEEREYNSLGAMGAAQWTGQFQTRPHALLELHNITSVDQWVNGLPRGCRRTIKKAIAMEEDGRLTVTTKPIMGGKPAPHSSLAHFRCVVAHEVRLIRQLYGDEAFLDALSEAVSRYVGTTRMTGEIREYRNATTGQVIGIAHEVTKGSTIRGQWFYCNDEAAKAYVWFHSVHDLVRRAIDMDGVDCVDLGPSGSDSFSELKARYGFRQVTDWPSIAKYQGEFWYCGKPRRGSAIDAPRRLWW
jgi:hypothetical protein